MGELFVPFEKDKIYVVCKQNKEIIYSNKNAYKKLDLIFKDINNTLFLKMKIKTGMIYLMVMQIVLPQNFMKKLSTFIN